MGRAYEVRKASIQKSGAAKGKLYTNFAKEIYLAAKAGVPDVELNVTLKRIVDKAKKSQIPNDIIDRAIEKAKGSSTDDYKEVIYEGFGPDGSSLIVKCLTDNVNRTFSLVREAFNKSKSKIGVNNSVSYNYDHLGVIGIKTKDGDNILEELLNNEIDVQEFEEEDELFVISVLPNEFTITKDVLENIIPDIDYEIDEVGMFAKEKVILEGESLELFNKLLTMLEDIEDVNEIYHNVELD